MTSLALEISVSACDEMRDCVLSEIPDRGACATSVVSTPPTTRAFVRSYTANPGVEYDPPCGDAHAHFMDPGTSDPESEAHPYWRRVWDSPIVLNESKCVIQSPPPTDGLLAVFEVSGVQGNLTFGRAPSSSVWFDRTEPVGVWIPDDPEHVELRVEMDQRYTFPGCCDFPASFNDTVGRLWRQAAHESTCGVVDSAEYVYEGLEYTTTAIHNGTHERWRFEAQFPGVGFCSPGFLTDSFAVDVFVPRADRDLIEVDEATPSVPYSSTKVYALVLGTVVGMMLLVLGIKASVYYLVKKKR